MKPGAAAFWVRIAFWFLIRSGRVTATLSVMVVTAVAALIFLSALAAGVKDAMLQNTVGLFSGHITGYDLPASIQPEDLMVKGVAGVLQRVYLPGVFSGNALAQPLRLCAIDPDQESRQTALLNKINQGRYPSKGRSEVLISRLIAESLNVQKGDAVRFTPRHAENTLTLSVAGIYQTGMDTLDPGIAFCTLDVIPETTLPWTAAVFLENGTVPQAVIDIYQQQWSNAYRFESWETQMPDLRQLIDLEHISMSIVIFLVFAVVAIGIAGSFVIFIIRNMREYGVMKAMGVTTVEMSMLIIIKVVLMNLIACSVGLVLGALVSSAVAHLGGIDISNFTSHNRYFTVSGIIYPRLTGFALWAPPAIALLFSLVAAVWPVALVARKRAGDILRLV